MKFEHILTNSANQTIIEIQGLTRPTSIFHLTDCHLNETDIREGAENFIESIRTSNYDTLETRTHFGKALEYANEQSFDCVVLTGDIINGATINNLEYLDKQLRTLQSPYLYTLGNHDWEYPHQTWCDETRRTQYSKFNQFTKGSPTIQVSNINGVNLITLDNSTYQVTIEQLTFVEKQLAGGLPTLLFMHIPIYIPSLLTDVMKTWKSPIMMAAEGWDKKQQKQWKVEEATAPTKDMYNLLMENPYNNLIGLFCGHVHFAHTDAFGHGSYQYVTQPGFNGGYRIIRLMPKI
jgi:predicted phosphodiesterase